MSQNLFDYLIFYSVFNVLFVTFLARLSDIKYPLLITAFLSFVIYVGINVDKLDSFKGLILQILNCLTIFVSTAGIAKLLEQKEIENKKVTKIEQIFRRRKYNGLKHKQTNSNKKPLFFKWF